MIPDFGAISDQQKLGGTQREAVAIDSLGQWPPQDSGYQRGIVQAFGRPTRMVHGIEPVSLTTSRDMLANVPNAD